MIPTKTETQENNSSNNYWSITTFFAGSLTSAALIAGTCYIKPELCISLFNTAAKESTALVISPSNTQLTAAWEGLKGTMIKFAQVQLTPTKEQLISSAITGVTSSIIEMTSSEAWVLKVDEIDEIIGGSDGHNYGPDQTLNEIDMSRIESDSNSGSDRSTPDLSSSGGITPDTIIHEKDDITGDSFREEESVTVSTRTRTSSVDYQGGGNELDLKDSAELPSDTTLSGREYQGEPDQNSQSTTPVNTPVKPTDTEQRTSPITDILEKRVSFEEPGDNTGSELMSDQTTVEMSGQSLPLENMDA